MGGRFFGWADGDLESGGGWADGGLRNWKDGRSVFKTDLRLISNPESNYVTLC